MAINSDSSGFLIGERRLREMSEGITQTEDNTKQILKVLSESLQEIQNTLASSNTNITDLVNRQNRGGRSQDASGSSETRRRVRSTVDAEDEAAAITEQALRDARRIRARSEDAGADSNQSSGTLSSSERAARARDSRGRFVGADGSSEAKSFFSRIKGMMGFGDASLGNADVSGIDPTVDAIRELGQIVSPVKNVFKGMSAKAIGIFRGRIKKKGTDEVLSEEEIEANRQEAKANKLITKLLKSILSAIRSQGGGGLLDGLGGLGGRGGGLLTLLKNGGKGLLKKIPFLGALIGGGFLAKDWKKLDSGGKGKGIGQIVGTIVGGALGSFFGPVGTLAGGGLGNYLGGIFGEKVGTWTDSLKKIDFGEIFKELMKAALNIGKKAFIPFAAGSAGFDALKKAGGWAAEKLGFGDSGSGGSTATVGDNIDYSNAPNNTNIGGNVATDPKARKLGMYNALRKAGFTHEQALAHGGQIGRENEYNDKMFSTHTDPTRDKHGNKIQNGGVMSWNGSRYKKFAAYMRERGLMDEKGNMPKTQATLDAQAAYMKQENDEPYYKEKMKKFNSDTHADPREYAADMQKNYGWARGQNLIRDENGNFTVPFDWKGAENRGNRNIDEIAALAKQQSDNLSKKPVQAAKGTPQNSILFKKGAARPPAVKVPAVTPELIKIGSKYQSKGVSATPTDGGIGQTVSDRSLAHISAGGIGYTQHNV